MARTQVHLVLLILSSQPQICHLALHRSDIFFIPPFGYNGISLSRSNLPFQKIPSLTLFQRSDYIRFKLWHQHLGKSCVVASIAPVDLLDDGRDRGPGARWINELNSVLVLKTIKSKQKWLKFHFGTKPTYSIVATGCKQLFDPEWGIVFP